MSTPRLKILSVGGNPVSAFLSWRLQASNACDVTVVWKKGHEHVAQYGISFRSEAFGNERFKPRRVVMTPEEAAATKDVYDYVILSIKSLPEVYDMAAVIQPVVTPEHTCILVNTTQAVGVESPLEERFPSNIVLSTVCAADVVQLGQSEFEHRGSTSMVWVGPANAHPTMAQVQTDMAHALELTLSSSSQIDCKVSKNIRQQQYERVIGPIAFYPLSVLFEMPNHQMLLENPLVRTLVQDIIDELLALATAQGCKFSTDFAQRTIEDMTRPGLPESIMWQDYVARRPMEVDTYLGSPIKLAKDLRMALPRIETIYAILRHTNTANLAKPLREPISPQATSPMPRHPPPNGVPRPMLNGMMPNGMLPNGMGRGPPPPGQGPPRPRGMSSNNGQRRPQMIGGPPPPNGYRPSAPPSLAGYGSRQASRRGSMEGADLEELSHMLHYAEDGLDHSGYFDRPDMPMRGPPPQQRRGGPPPRMPPGMPPHNNNNRRPPQHVPRHGPNMYDDSDDDVMPFDPSGGSGPPMIDPDNFDMMSVTSRKNRVMPPPGQSQAQFRKNAEAENSMMARAGRFRPAFNNRYRQQSAAAVGISTLGDNILDDPMMGYSSNRYGTVDRGVITESRTNSLTSQRLDELQYGPGPGGASMGPNGVPRRTSHSPATHYPPQMRGALPGMNGGRPSPGMSATSPGGFSNGRPSPPQLHNGRFPNGPHGDHLLPDSSLAPGGDSQSASLSSASANSGDTHPSSASDQGGRLAVGVR